MLNVVTSNRFIKDLKTLRKRGMDLSLLDQIVEKIANDVALDSNNRDHQLVGDYVNFRECHIKSDWIMIYRINFEQSMVILLRTGTHSDLFD